MTSVLKGSDGDARTEMGRPAKITAIMHMRTEEDMDHVGMVLNQILGEL